MENNFVKESYLKWEYISWWSKTADHQASFSLQQTGSEDIQSCSSQVILLINFLLQKQREVQSFFYIWKL